MKRVHGGVVACACFVLRVPVRRRIANGHVPLLWLEFRRKCSRRVGCVFLFDHVMSWRKRLKIMNPKTLLCLCNMSTLHLSWPTTAALPRCLCGTLDSGSARHRHGSCSAARPKSPRSSYPQPPYTSNRRRRRSSWSPQHHAPSGCSGSGQGYCPGIDGEHPS